MYGLHWHSGTQGECDSLYYERAKRIITAGLTPNRLLSILLRILGRQASLRPQRYCRWWLWRRQCRRLRPDPQRCIRLHDDYQRRLCHCSNHLLRGLRIRLRCNSHIREIQLDFSLHLVLRLDRPSRSARIRQRTGSGYRLSFCRIFSELPRY